MRSGTSFFNGTVFKKTVFRFWPLWTVYFVGWLFAMPLYALTMLRLDAASIGYVYDADRSNYLLTFAQHTVPQSVTRDAAILFAIFSVLAAMAVFSHLYNPRSANLFGSLPIRREGLFLTHYLAGLCFLVVPNLVIFLLTLAVEAAGGAVVWKGLLFWLAVSCGEGFFFYTLAVFCAMFTGHILALPAFYAIVNGIVMGVTGLVAVVLEWFYYGFVGVPDSVFEAALWFTPVGKLFLVVNYRTVYVHEDVTNSILSNDKQVLEFEGLDAVGIYAVAALVLAVCAFLLYRRRRLESAGDVVAVNAMKPVFKYGVAVCVGLAFGLGTMAILYGGELTLMIAIVVWGVIGYFAAEMLLQKSFKVFKKWKGAVAVAAVFIILFCVVGFDLTGFESRVPNPDSVESVTVSGLDMMYLDDSGDSFDGTITDRSQIGLITLVHRAAVEQKDVDQWSGTGTSTSLRVTYHLKNGGTLSRSYNWIWVQPDEIDREGTAAWAIQQLYNNRELCWQMYGFDELESYLAEGGRLTEAGHEFYDGETGWTNAYYYGDDAVALLAAVKEDFFAGRIGVRRVTADRWGDYDWKNHAYLYFNSDYRGGYGSYYIRIILSDTATSTQAALEEMADRAVVYNWEYDKWYEDDVIADW